MKKIKIMLLSLALFAVVGGALAFKARFTDSFCTAPYLGGSAPLCPNLTINSVPDSESGVVVWTVAPPYFNGDDPTCTTNSGLQVITAQCVASTSLIVDGGE
jgi:hypothetical protein